MSVVEDVRQVIQDFVAPELKSLDTRVAHFESSMNQRFANSEALANARHEATTAQIGALRGTTTAQIETLREVLSGQIAHLTSVVASNHTSIQEKLDLNKRIERIEMFQAARYEVAQTPHPARRCKALKRRPNADLLRVF